MQVEQAGYSRNNKFIFGNLLNRQCLFYIKAGRLERGERNKFEENLISIERKLCKEVFNCL